MTVGSSNVTIRTIVPLSISAEPYRKAIVAILFFRRILTLSKYPSIYFSDLTAMVALYFDMNTGSAEREVERIVEFIPYDFVDVTNL